MNGNESEKRGERKKERESVHSVEMRINNKDTHLRRSCNRGTEISRPWINFQVGGMKEGNEEHGVITFFCSNEVGLNGKMNVFV